MNRRVFSGAKDRNYWVTQGSCLECNCTRPPMAAEPGYRQQNPTRLLCATACIQMKTTVENPHSTPELTVSQGSTPCPTPRRGSCSAHTRPSAPPGGTHGLVPGVPPHSPGPLRQVPTLCHAHRRTVNSGVKEEAGVDRVRSPAHLLWARHLECVLTTSREKGGS